MPDTQLTNPAAEESEGWSTAQVIEEYVFDPNVTGYNLQNGDVVIISGGYTPSTGVTSATVVSSTAYPVIAIASTTPGFNNIGVVVNAPTGGYTPGSVVQVCVEGVAQVLCDANNTVFGELLVAGSTTAGAATISASATAGKTIATCLQTATIGSGTALIYGWVHVR